MENVLAIVIGIGLALFGQKQAAVIEKWFQTRCNCLGHLGRLAAVADDLSYVDDQPLQRRAPHNRFRNHVQFPYSFPHIGPSQHRMESSKPPDSLDVGVEDDGFTVTLLANLPPGEYVISLFVGFPANEREAATAGKSSSSVCGDTVYGLHVKIA